MDYVVSSINVEGNHRNDLKKNYSRGSSIKEIHTNCSLATLSAIPLYLMLITCESMKYDGYQYQLSRQ